jgi:hypothetical protein
MMDATVNLSFKFMVSPISKISEQLKRQFPLTPKDTAIFEPAERPQSTLWKTESGVCFLTHSLGDGDLHFGADLGAQGLLQ